MREATQAGAALLDQFQLDTGKDIEADALGCRPGGVLVPVRDYNTLSQLDWVLDEPESENRDVVVLTVRMIGGQRRLHGSIDLSDEVGAQLGRLAATLGGGCGERLAHDLWSCRLDRAAGFGVNRRRID